MIAETPRLFAAAQNAYDAERNLLPLNNQAEPGTTSDLYRSRLRDRLAGLCRRLIVMFHCTAGGATLADSGCASSEAAFWNDLFTVPEPPALPPATSPPIQPAGHADLPHRHRWTTSPRASTSCSACSTASRWTHWATSTVPCWRRSAS